MNELALFNDLFDGFEDDGYLMPSFNFRKAFAAPKVDVKEEKKEEKAEAKTAGKYLIKERSYTKFSRSFTLPEDVDSEKLSAKVTNGVLTVTMPRKAIAAPKRIAITAE